MALTVIAFLMFLAMVAAWVVLPGSMIALPFDDSADPMPATASQADAIPAPAVGQTA